MEIKSIIQLAFEKIHFVERYQEFVTRHHHKVSEYLAEYDENEMIALMKKILHRSDVVYLKSEHSFIIRGDLMGLHLVFGVSLGHGGADVYTNISRDNAFLGGGSWARVYMGILGELPEDSLEVPFPRPDYCSLIEVEQLVTEAYAIYEDFKKALTEQLEKEG